MAFDFHLHIPEDSKRGQAIQKLAKQQHITHEQAAERLLEEAAQLHLETSPAEQMWGAFSSPEDSEVLDRAMEHVHELRKADKLRDFSV